MSGVVADTSVWIDFFAGRPATALTEALAEGVVVLSPIVIAELVSGARRPRQREAVVDLLRDLAVHETPPDHWIRVGDLRRTLAAKGVAVSTPDAHVAQCALDLAGVLLTRDRVFGAIARVTGLRLAATRN